MLGGAADEVRQSAVARDWLLQGGTFAAFYEHTTREAWRASSRELRGRDSDSFAACGKGTRPRCAPLRPGPDSASTGGCSHAEGRPAKR